MEKLDDENRRLRKELKDVVRSQFDGLETNSNVNDAFMSQMMSTGGIQNDELVNNLEEQLHRMKQVLKNVECFNKR